MTALGASIPEDSPTIGESSRSTEQLLKQLGANTFDMRLPEAHVLNNFIREGEHIRAVVFGRYKQQRADSKLIGRGLLAATDQRVLLLDKKPLYVRCYEIPYKTISGITYSRVVLAGTVTVYSKTGEIRIRTFNDKCAHRFVGTVETKILQE